MIYRAAWATDKKSIKDAKDALDYMMRDIIKVTGTSKEAVKVFLTGKGNFRYDLVKLGDEYKGTRKDVRRPVHKKELIEYMNSEWPNVITSEGEEADDLIGIGATDAGPTCVVVTVDKDMLQLPCEHYNPVRREWQTVTEWEGLKFFYTQILTGDKADNIIGLMGIGPVKAKKILEECHTEAELYLACVVAYEGDTAKVLENGRLLWLRRYIGQLWEYSFNDDTEDSEQSST